MNDEFEIPDPLGEGDNVDDEVEKKSSPESESDTTLVDGQPVAEEMVDAPLEDSGSSADGIPLSDEPPVIEVIEKKNKWPTWAIVVVVLVLAAFCCCCLLSVVGITWLWDNGDRLFGSIITGFNNLTTYSVI